jgi:hypothetical protein
LEPRLASRCGVLAVTALLIAGLLLLRAVWMWSNFDSVVLPHYLTQGPRVSPGTQHAWQVPVAGVVSGIPLLLVCAALLRASRIFRLVSRGERIATGVIDHLSGIASLVFWAAVTRIPAEAVVSVLLTLNNPVGERSLRLGFEGAELVGIVAAGLLWTLTATLREALALRRENDGFI